MRTRSTVSSISIAGTYLWLSVMCLSAAEPPKSLVSLKANYGKALQGIVTNYNVAVSNWRPTYLNDLRALQVKLQKEGDLDGWTDIKAEMTRFQQEESITASDLSARQDVAALQAKYIDAPGQAALDKSRKVIALSDKYLAKLASLQTDLTKQGKIDEALLVNEETKRVKASPEVSAARFDVEEHEAGALLPETNVVEKTATPSAGAGTVGEKLDQVSIPRFSCSGYDVARRIGMLTRLADVAAADGIRIRLAAKSLRITSVSVDSQGKYNYYSEDAGHGSFEGEPMELREQTLRAILEGICERLRVGYRVDEDKREVVVLDASAPDVEWVPEGMGQPKKDAPAADPLGVQLPEFSFSENDLRSPAALFNRLVSAMYSKGVRIRPALDSAGITSIRYEFGGMPNFSGNYRSEGATDGRMRQFRMTGVSGIEAIQAVCTLAGMGYKIDAKSGEVVLLDPTAADVQWAPADITAEQLAQEGLSLAGRDKHIGKTVIVRGRVGSMVQGMNDSIIVSLDNKIRLSLTKEGPSARQYGEFKDKANECKELNKSNEGRNFFVDVTAMGRVAKGQVGGPTLEKCVVMSLYVDSVETDKKRVIRLGEGR